MSPEFPWHWAAGRVTNVSVRERVEHARAMDNLAPGPAPRRHPGQRPAGLPGI